MHNRLKYLRSEKKITQRQLAKFLNLSSSTIAMYETGKRKPDCETLKGIADFFDVSTDYLLGRTDILNVYTKQMGYISFDVSDLSEKDIAKIEEYVELLKQKYNLD
ncbi:helix-turn-helix domain-containing protein [Wukongibacter sp. M2B1]|uniref:helix-turn-helix domain-containing protein n=1 Tax=Wukongibacter sp. M2B1 TaxID=3088895 RepID=UPI003D78EFB7